MSAGILQSADLFNITPACAERPNVRRCSPASKWNSEIFADEQIRGLVRQVFFSNVADPVRHVVFCSAEPRNNDVQSICLKVAQTLAQDTQASVAVITYAAGCNRRALSSFESHDEVTTSESGGPLLKQSSIQLRRNLWLVPQVTLLRSSDARNATLSSRLNELRREFRYSIVQGPSAHESGQLTALGQSTDGVVLVLAAHLTRRATALRIKEMLEATHVRLLGTVLSERRFPIPERIYRRL